MSLPSNLKPERVFKYFEEISAVPRGSGNMKQIADYCEAFAEGHSLEFVRDSADNIVIYKSATAGFENSPSVILQGHLDIVCQKKSDCDIDFLNDGLDIYADGDFIAAHGTTLGADNGIAAAMILAVLEAEDIPHPPLEAVFTTDEEIGMVGAAQLDMSLLKSKKMINLDAEDDGILTVSCAGGANFGVEIPLKRESVQGTELTVKLKGLKGGHSGVEINSGRVNANILAGRFLNYMRLTADYEIISINGGDKNNAITNECNIVLCVNEPEHFASAAEECLNVIKAEIAAREPDFAPCIAVGAEGEYSAFERKAKDSIIYTLLCVPNGVVEMSAEIDGLVETSLNLGVLKTQESELLLEFALRSNKLTSLEFLEQRLRAFFANIDCKIETSGYYPPWEFNPDSTLSPLYCEAYKELFGSEPKVEAIHAGLECGLFASRIDGIDCVAFGPQLFDVHTVNERLSISSAERTYRLLLKILEKCK